MGTHPQDDKSKKKLDTCEQEEGTGHLEINIPMAKISSNIDPSPTYPYRKKTLLADEEH